jgi:hypothetical protein
MYKRPETAKNAKSSNKKVDPTIVVALITVVGTILAALLASPVLIALIQKTSSPEKAPSVQFVVTPQSGAPPEQAIITPPTATGAPVITNTAASASLKPMDKSIAIIASQEGQVYEVPADSVRFQTDTLLPLANGISVPFNKIKSVEVVEADEREVSITVTMLDGTVVNEKLGVSVPGWSYLEAATDLGNLKLTILQVKRVDFQR